MDENKLEEAMADTVEQSFNDSELEDIMNEIENLEKEFVEDGEKSPEDLALSEAPVSSLQDEIDKEVESFADEMTPVVEEAPVAEVTAEVEEKEIEQEIVADAAVEMVEEESTDNVVQMPVAEVQAPTSNSGANMDFSASGEMSLNLNFKIGSETATLKVDGEGGLVVDMAGVEVKISETEGCTITMEGGVNFNIPLTTNGEAAKKKVA